jgi:hypothetical protein
MMTKQSPTSQSSARLVTNRYNQLTPTTIQANGCAISTPFYINPTTDQTKQLLNAFRTVKQKELLEAGLNNEPVVTPGGIVVETAKTLPLAPIEQELGMNEDSLRHVLFARQGIPERLVLKLQRLTGVYVITREQIEDTFKQWCDYLYSDSNSDAKTTTETKKRRTATTA